MSETTYINLENPLARFEYRKQAGISADEAKRDFTSKMVRPFRGLRSFNDAKILARHYKSSPWLISQEDLTSRSIIYHEGKYFSNQAHTGQFRLSLIVWAEVSFEELDPVAIENLTHAIRGKPTSSDIILIRDIARESFRKSLRFALNDKNHNLKCCLSTHLDEWAQTQLHNLGYEIAHDLDGVTLVELD